MIQKSVFTGALFTLVALLAGCNPQVPQIQEDHGPAPRFDKLAQNACPFFPGTTAPAHVECGYVVVRENRSDPDKTRNVKLAVAIIHQDASKRSAVATINLEGGPGGSSAWRVPVVANKSNGYSQDWLAAGDVVIYDQRGIGKSRPELSCPYPETDGDCFNRLQKIADLNQYNTKNSAADIADIASVLGYSALNVYGSSYGTQLAQRFMRDFPAKIRGVVLDAVVDPASPFVMDGSRRFNQSFLTLQADCQKDAACNKAYPDLAGTLKAVLKDLDSRKVMVTLLDDKMQTVYDRGKPYQFQLTSGLYLNALRQFFYSRNVIRRVPSLLYSTRDKHYEELSSLLYTFFVLEEEDDFSEGVYNSVICSDALPFTNKQAGLDSEAQLTEPFKSYMTGFHQRYFDICAQWPVKKSDDQAAQRTPSDLSTVLLSGRYDPITPEAEAIAVASALTHKQTIYFRAYSHGAVNFTRNTTTGMLDSTCGSTLFRDFLLNPEQDLTRPCTETPLEFILPSSALQQKLSANLLEDLKLDPAVHQREPWGPNPFR
ncbi:alpha/beta hydrolase [Deinococcus roseus]|uniref:Alpha/beta hydrolase n=1 Tax=Deinococcus roseus TaxID=392414 RepID=A0ABQ2D637_9DEIO|nr:alpha/beta fold hydrolase [Deinococcus roseus]GGJ45228.1 alpha/beta hydrolase [Deinococcus roseus]